MTPKQAYEKVIILGKRIPKLEPIISKDALYGFYYARHIIEGRWELGEPTISQDAFCSYCYAFDIIKGRFILGEAAISKNTYWSYFYAQDVIRGRLPDFMHNQMILSNDEYTKEYVKFIQ